MWKMKTKKNQYHNSISTNPRMPYISFVRLFSTRFEQFSVNGIQTMGFELYHFIHCKKPHKTVFNNLRSTFHALQFVDSRLFIPLRWHLLQPLYIITILFHLVHGGLWQIGTFSFWDNSINSAIKFYLMFLTIISCVLRFGCHQKKFDYPVYKILLFKQRKHQC